MLHLLGIDHERLTYRFQGRDFRLTDVQRARGAGGVGVIVTIELQGPFRLIDPTGTPHFERCAVLEERYGIYLETIEASPAEYLVDYVGCSYGNSMCKRIAKRVDHDRHFDCRVDADAFLCGKRVPLPGNRTLDFNDPVERKQIDRIYAALRYFVARIEIDDDTIASWLGAKHVQNPHRYFVECVENEVIKTIRQSAGDCMSSRTTSRRR